MGDAGQYGAHERWCEEGAGDTEARYAEHWWRPSGRWRMRYTDTRMCTGGMALGIDVLGGRVMLYGEEAGAGARVMRACAEGVAR